MQLTKNKENVTCPTQHVNSETEGLKMRLCPILTEDLSMEPNSKHLLKKMGKNDQKVGAQADRPTINSNVNCNENSCLLQNYNCIFFPMI